MTVNDSVHVLFSIASGIAAPSRIRELDYDVFLGLQFFPQACNIPAGR